MIEFQGWKGIGTDKVVLFYLCTAVTCDWEPGFRSSKPPLHFVFPWHGGDWTTVVLLPHHPAFLPPYPSTVEFRVHGVQYISEVDT